MLAHQLLQLQQLAKPLAASLPQLLPHHLYLPQLPPVNHFLLHLHLLQSPLFFPQLLKLALHYLQLSLPVKNGAGFPAPKGGRFALVVSFGTALFVAAFDEVEVVESACFCAILIEQ